MKDFFSWIKTIIIAVAIGFVITMVIQPVLISGPSMYPTISPDDFVIMNKIPYVFSEPKAGEIVVFNSKQHTLDGQEKDYIKRIVGLPGDSIEITAGKVYLNGELLEEVYIPGGVTTGEVPKTQIEDGKIFVMGDNRAQSLDSRDPSVGQVSLSEIRGKVILRLFPFDKLGVIE